MGALLGLVQSDKVGTSKVVLAKEGEASLSTSRGLDDDVVQHTASCRNGNVVLLIDGGKITKTSKDTNLGQLTALLGCLQNSGNSLRAARAGLTSGLGLLSTCLQRKES